MLTFAIMSEGLCFSIEAVMSQEPTEPWNAGPWLADNQSRDLNDQLWLVGYLIRSVPVMAVHRTRRLPCPIPSTIKWTFCSSVDNSNKGWNALSTTPRLAISIISWKLMMLSAVVVSGIWSTKPEYNNAPWCLASEISQNHVEFVYLFYQIHLYLLSISITIGIFSK